MSEGGIYRNVGWREVNVEISNPGRTRRMAPTQVELVEQALRFLTGIHHDDGWGTIPVDLRRIFERYMRRDCWTGESDLFTLREAALLVVRDAITQTGEFAEEVEL